MHGLVVGISRLCIVIEHPPVSGVSDRAATGSLYALCMALCMALCHASHLSWCILSCAPRPAHVRLQCCNASPGCRPPAPLTHQRAPPLCPQLTLTTWNAADVFARLRCLPPRRADPTLPAEFVISSTRSFAASLPESSKVAMAAGGGSSLRDQALTSEDAVEVSTPTRPEPGGGWAAPVRGLWRSSSASHEASKRRLKEYCMEKKAPRLGDEGTDPQAR
eukprot:CAMPEP_0181251296 /NCGR_PEP_ID=MMETSP1096-20121128/46806_1 /TAXON_ID=156174 ORGANISM="Chrysochromulina ericina, Strain CCMP281" /NCGR_SAMPLE_ID=MMETSP1096 /ASSEMBLY_ACC=CAM_ASM_000453 /LENGTH=219 /DNA_ID=CAMNT_0023348879 /DNA_START=240 /DNA_END=897 /DNA_ORIENTATION=+